MKWINKAVGQQIVDGDWVETQYLGHIDPYLVWFDITNFEGASLPEGGLLPMMECRVRGEPRYKTSLRRVDDLKAFLDKEFGVRKKVSRFEIAPGIVNDDADRQPFNEPMWHAADPELRRGASKKTVVGFIDYGCAFAHRKFRQIAAGFKTRVLSIWDQVGAVPPPPSPLKRLQWRVPPDFGYGTETHRDNPWTGDKRSCALNEYIEQFAPANALDEEACYRHSGYAAVVGRHATHGTHIMDVATGSPNPIKEKPKFEPHDADIVFVQLPRYVRGRQVGGLLRANVFDGLRYIESCAAKDANIVVNLSYGGYAGPHDGSSVLECAIDEFLRTHREDRSFELVIPSGNSRDKQLHAQGLIQGGKSTTFRWNNLPDDPSDSFVEIWLPRGDGFEISVSAPGGGSPPTTQALAAGSASSLYRDADFSASANKTPRGCPTAVLVFVKKACQSNRGTMALLAVGPTRTGGSRPAAPYGQWKIEVHNKAGTPATVDAWCELDNPAFGTEGLPRQAYFTADELVTSQGTLNSIAHGREPIVVGGFAGGGPVASYSGTGPGRGLLGRKRHPKSRAGDSGRGPQVLATSDESTVLPGIAAAAVIGSDTVRLSGTSVAAAAYTRLILDTDFDLKRRAARLAKKPSSSGPKGVPVGKLDPDEDLQRVVP